MSKKKKMMFQRDVSCWGINVEDPKSCLKKERSVLSEIAFSQRKKKEPQNSLLVAPFHFFNIWTKNILQFKIYWDWELVFFFQIYHKAFLTALKGKNKIIYFKIGELY